MWAITAGVPRLTMLLGFVATIVFAIPFFHEIRSKL